MKKVYIGVIGLILVGLIAGDLFAGAASTVTGNRRDRNISELMTEWNRLVNATSTLASITTVGAATVGGNLAVTGTAAVTGNTTLSGTLTNPKWAYSEIGTTAVFTSANYGTYVVVTGAVTAAITLPANGATIGSWIGVVHGAATTDSTVTTVSAATTDTLVGPADQDLKSVTWGAGHRIGAQALFWSDGAFWHVQNLGGTTMTYTD